MLIRRATPSDAAGIARVQVDSWHTTYKGLIPDHLIASRTYERREALWTRILNEQPETIVYVAETEAGEIVGFVSGGESRDDHPVYKAELHAIYILEAHQGKGIGRALTSALVCRLIEQGLRSMLLWVLTENWQARAFYASLDGKVVGERQEEMGDVALDEVAYGWDDISPLCLSPAAG